MNRYRTTASSSHHYSPSARTAKRRGTALRRLVDKVTPSLKLWFGPYLYPFRFVPQTMAIALCFLLMLGLVLFSMDHAFFYRSTQCVRQSNRIVMCQHHHRSLLGLRSSDQPPFQLQIPEVTTYRFSRSDCDNISYHTGYQLDLTGVQADGQRQVVTFQQFKDYDQRAYQKLGMMLDLMSGFRQAPMQGRDWQVNGYVLWILMAVVPVLYRLIRHQLRALRTRLML